MTIEIYKTDVGTQFIIQMMDRQPDGTKIALDITTASVLKMVWTKPDGTQITKTNSDTPAVSLLNTGSDGKMQFTNKNGSDQSIDFTTQADDFWKIEGEVTLADGKKFHTVEKGQFKVIDRL